MTRSSASGVRRWLPGVAVLRSYQPAWLARDLIAGLVLAALLVPQGMAYAELAGLPPITGLYTTVVALGAYALVGPSRVLVLGPDSSLGPMIAAVVLPLAAGSPEAAVALAGLLALLVGLICVVTGVARLGFVADLISKPVRIGYLAGLAVTIFIGQLPKLFGFSIDADGLVDEALTFLSSLDETVPAALAVGLLTLAIILVLKRAAPRVPGILVAMVVSIAVTVLFGLAAYGVSVVGVLPQGFPRPALPGAGLENLPILAFAALGISLVAIGDTISTSAGFAARRGDEVDNNQELVGIGAANLLAGLFQGFPVSTSGSRTAVAEQSGSQSQVTGWVAAGAVLVMLLFVPGLVKNLPQSALAAVVIVASFSLFDVGELRRLATVRRSEFTLALASLLGVALVGVLPGIVIAILLSMFQSFERSWRPYSAILGESAALDGYHDITRHTDARQIPGLLIFRWDAPLFFANANIFRDRIRQLVAETTPTPYWVLLAAEPVTDVDTTAAEVLVDLDLELNSKGIHIAFAELKDPARDRILAYGLFETFDAGHFYPTLQEAVAAFRLEAAEARPDLPPFDTPGGAA
jgi:high affinity sulfate transporter 1